MTRINTNLSSLVAQKTLQRSNSQLNEALTRLSTGLKINSGKDDPAGLIASESLRSDITSTKKAITNSERANQLIATADSALGQVTSLLNDIRGLVSEAANTGALSDSQIQANQLQIDSSLEAIDRISQVTQFQGRRLLDGNLDFTTSGVSSNIQDLQIDQANFGSLDQIGVNVNVVKQATQGKLTFNNTSIDNDVVLEIAGSNGTEAFNFGSGSSIDQIASAVNLVSDATGVRANVEEAPAKAGEITVSSFGADNDIVLTAKQAGKEAGNYRVRYDASAGTDKTTVAYTAPDGDTAGTIDVTLATTQWTAASREIDFDTTTGTDDNNALKITAKLKGEDFNGVKLKFTSAGGVGANPTFAYDHDTKTLTVNIEDGTTTANDIVTALANDKDVAALFSITNVGDSNGSGTITATDTNGQAVLDAFNNDNTTTGVKGGLGGGVDGGQITATAADVVAAINATDGLKDLVGAALADGNDGTGTVTDFAQSASYGTVEDNNRLQFLGPDGSRDIQFKSTANTALSVELDPATANESKAQAIVQGAAANSSFVVTAKNAGDDYNDVKIVLNDSTDNTVVFDKEGKTLTFNVDLTGGSVSAADLKSLLENDEYAGKFFDIQLRGDGTGNFAATDDDRTVGTTSGGGADDGKLIVNLATNAAGQVTTTAQDLIDYFNSTDSAIVNTLKSQGISITNVEGSDGSGLLAATADGEDIKFATSGRTFTDAAASVTTTAVNGANAQLTFTAKTAGAAYDGVKIVFKDDAGVTAGNEKFAYDEDAKTLTVSIDEGTTTAKNIADALDDTGNEAVAALFTVTAGGDGSGEVTATEKTAAVTTLGGTNAKLTITAKDTGGDYDDYKFVFKDDGSVTTAGNEKVAFDEDTKTFTVTIFDDATNGSTADQVKAALNANTDFTDLFTIADAGTDDGSGKVTVDDTDETTITHGGLNDYGVTSGGVVQGGTTDGASFLGNADAAGTGLSFTAVEYGSDNFVSVKALSGTFDLTDATGATNTRSTGTDVNARINGIQSVGKGLRVSLNTSSLDLSFNVAASAASGSTYDFNITGGGALFQLGPSVVSNQQARLGIQSVSTATLGGVSGRLFELRSGGAKALDSDVGGAAKVVEEVLSSITSLRGRLGAFQKTTLETNIYTLNDTLANLTEAESSIRDADFAAESANLTRAQILVQSGTRVLSIANNNPQNVLSLLRG